MDEQKLSSSLASINNWWTGNDVPKKIKKADTRRKIFYDLSKNCLNNKEICCISGPRQVGKTTLMGQLIDFQIKEKKINPMRIVYMPLDSEFLTLHSDNVLVDSLKVYFENVLGEAPQNLKDTVYIYLDEIQSLDRWSKQLKSYYDLYENVKFIISGSSQTKLYNDATESLVGRIQFRLVLPFKFREFLDFNLEEKEKSRAFEFSTHELREALKISIEKNDPSAFYKKITNLQIRLTSELPKIKKLLNTYLIKGGYPGVLEFGEDYDKALERIKTDLELTVYKDIHKIFNTRNSSDLMSLLVLIASSSGQKINYSKLASVIGVDRRVVANYLNYTQLVFLTCESQVYRNNKYKQAEKNNKSYMMDVGQRNALIGKMNEQMLNEADAGLAIQTAVFNHATRLRFYLTGHKDYDIFYWEDGSNEVDIVMDLPITVLPLEVKSKSGEKGLGAVHKFMEEHKKSKWGIIVTKDDLKLEKNILLMPLWAFLIMG